jgi:H/ACA ribonucleoprotein complex subunit 4
MLLKTLLNRSVILIDKPRGPTSFDIVEKVSRILNVKKAGHSGTLDPNATGLLVIALGEARKAMPVLTGLDKEYIGIMLLHGNVSRLKLERALSSFRGKIRQVPPVKSAVARKKRERTVHELEVTAVKGRSVEFRVACEAGTYIRKIASDLGEELGCGAHLVELRRTKVGPFTLEGSATIPELERMTKRAVKSFLVPLEEALDKTGLPRVVIRKGKELVVRNGSPIRKDFVKEMSGNPKEGEYVGIYDDSWRIVCLAKFGGKGDTVASTERVFLM